MWCFATKKLCYYVITKSSGSPVVEKVLGTIFKGILICDFRGAYNKISALARQRCFYHLFTELVKVDKHNPSSEWRAFRKKLSRLLKVSQQNRSEQGVKAQAILMTLFRTAELQGRNPVETVLSAVKNTIESKNASIGCFKKAA